MHMESLFPLYSLFGFIVLHMLVYAIYVYAWRRYRVNYTFIFGFKQGTELGYWEVFLITSVLATLALATVLVNLDMEMDKKTKDFQTLTELVPLMLVILVILITVCPSNIVYRSSRYVLLVCLFHCVCAPFYKVLLTDFFLADQLTSQCLHRLFEEKTQKEGYNAFKYFSTIVAVAIRTVYRLNNSMTWFILALVSSSTSQPL